jgi:hypothetical protein
MSVDFQKTTRCYIPVWQKFFPTTAKSSTRVTNLRPRAQGIRLLRRSISRSMGDIESEATYML